MALRYVRVETVCASPDAVRSDRARDRVVSMYNEKREREIDEQRQGLVLAPLFAKPRPVWLAPTLTALFGDPFIEGTTFEGSSAMPWSFCVLNFAMQAMLRPGADGQLQGLLACLGGGAAARAALADVLYVLRRSAPCFTIAQRLLKLPNQGQLFSFLRRLKKLLNGLGVGESMLVPAFITSENQELVLIVQRTTQLAFRFVVVNTSPEGGLRHHAVRAGEGSSSKLQDRHLPTRPLLRFLPVSHRACLSFIIVAHSRRVSLDLSLCLGCAHSV